MHEKPQPTDKTNHDAVGSTVNTLYRGREVEMMKILPIYLKLIEVSGGRKGTISSHALSFSFPLVQQAFAFSSFRQTGKIA